MSLGIPYVSVRTNKGKPYVKCPDCGDIIQITKRKDWESWSTEEYAAHWQQEHSTKPET